MSLRFAPAARGPVLAALALAAIAPALGGCGERSFTWVGVVEDTDAVGAVTVEEGALRAYVCGGPDTYSTLSRWFSGNLNGANRVATTTDGWSFQGEVGEGYAIAEIISPEGDYYVLDATSPDDELAGLYSVEDAGCRTGAVVYEAPAGGLELQGTWCDDQGHRAQVTPVYPISVTEKGILVQVDLEPLGLGGVRDLHVTRDSGR
jgi:hypothetical protein